MTSSARQEREPNFDYAYQACDFLPFASYKQAIAIYNDVIRDEGSDIWVVSQLGLHDRFFFLTQILKRRDALREWLYARCREVEAETDGCLDLWAREHYKSTIITFAGSLQEIAKGSDKYPELFGDRRDYDMTIGIFSHTRPIAKAFLNQIKLECEQNSLLHQLYPDVYWANPKKEAPVWSLDNGIYCKRKGNAKEGTVEAWGLVDGQPTSKHYRLMIYDDVVTRESVTTPDQIIKTTEAWELSRNLSAQTDDDSPRRTWTIGTRYSFADTYQEMLNRKVFKPRIYPATDNGLVSGKPVLLSQADWDIKVKESSMATIACQQLLNPIAGSEQEFKPEWLRSWEVRPETLNVVVLVDPASSKKIGSCNTAMAVIGIDAAFNKYLLDGACHKMSLTERWQYVKGFRQKWLRQPGVQVVHVGYEKYGMQADIEHFEMMMQLEKCPFPITEVSWTRDHVNAKDDRIRRLIPDHQNWRFFYPWEPDKSRNEKDTRQMRDMTDRGKGYLCAKPIKQRNEEGKIYNLFHYLVQNEYLFFPATTHKDFMDAMSRIYDMQINPPQVVKESDTLPVYYGEP